LDWAGTAVDYGSIGPVAVFLKVFEQFGVPVSAADARSCMGLAKKDHIRQMCRLPSVQNRWVAHYGKAPTETDVNRMYREVERQMVTAIADTAVPIEGLLETVQTLRDRGVRIGSSTGYTAPMMIELLPAAAARGYSPDAVVCSSDVPAGRPFPWMCFQNAIELEVYPLEAMVKIGDTVSDIAEGLNAGMWTIGVTRTGNELGLTEEEADNLPSSELDGRLAEISQRFYEAGAHYTAEGIWAVPLLINEIEARLAKGEQPLSNRDRIESNYKTTLTTA
jgi:phosphonoacetaldehyde hydrolase